MHMYIYISYHFSIPNRTSPVKPGLFGHRPCLDDGPESQRHKASQDCAIPFVCFTSCDIYTIYDMCVYVYYMIYVYRYILTYVL